MGARKWFIALVDVSVSTSKCFGERMRAFERIFANEHINHLLILCNFVHEHAKCSTWSPIEGNLWAVVKQETKWNETGSHTQNIDSDCVVATEDHMILPWLCSTVKKLKNLGSEVLSKVCVLPSKCLVHFVTEIVPFQPFLLVIDHLLFHAQFSASLLFLYENIITKMTPPIALSYIRRLTSNLRFHSDAQPCAALLSNHTVGTGNG